MVDLGLALDAAKPQIDSLLATSGCTVHLRRPVDPAGAAADPATLTAAATPNAPYASRVPAVVLEVPGGSSDGHPERPAVTSRGVIVIGPGYDTSPRVELVVASCRDPRLIGRVYAVTQVQRNVAGLAQVLDVEHVRGT